MSRLCLGDLGGQLLELFLEGRGAVVVAFKRPEGHHCVEYNVATGSCCGEALRQQVPMYTWCCQIAEVFTTDVMLAGVVSWPVPMKARAFDS